MEKIRLFLKKFKEEISYLFFGVLTTIVNFVVYALLLNFLQLPAYLSNVVAWVASVLFAYVTNKLYVFQSKDWSKATVFPEVWKFIASRTLSGLLETVFLLITVDALSLNGNLMKVIIAVIVVILNYITSKMLVFKK